jgi:hypothetical protein
LDRGFGSRIWIEDLDRGFGSTRFVGYHPGGGRGRIRSYTQDQPGRWPRSLARLLHRPAGWGTCQRGLHSWSQ